MRVLHVTVLLILLGGCAHRDARAWATVGHAGEALERGADPKSIGKALKILAIRHAEMNNYQIEGSQAWTK